MRRMSYGFTLSCMRAALKPLEGGSRVPEWTLGDRLRKARESAGLEQAELAMITGLARQTVSNYERDAVHPRATGVRLWALATGVPVVWLESGEAPPDFPGPGEPVAARTGRHYPMGMSDAHHLRGHYWMAA